MALACRQRFRGQKLGKALMIFQSRRYVLLAYVLYGKVIGKFHRSKTCKEWGSFDRNTKNDR